MRALAPVLEQKTVRLSADKMNRFVFSQQLRKHLV